MFSLRSLLIRPIDAEGIGRIALCFGTCNVLTLKGVDEPQWGLQGVARQDSILEQFHLQGIHIVALQETRLKKLFRAKDDRYVLVKSAATAFWLLWHYPGT